MSITAIDSSDNPLHILYIGYPLQDNRAPHQAMGALYLSRQGISISYMAWGKHQPPIWLKTYLHIQYNLCFKQGILSAFIFLMRLFLIFYLNKIDCVYVQGAQQTPFVFWMPFLLGKNRYIIYHTQDYLEPGKYRFYAAFERFFAKRANWVICNEPNRARFMASHYKLRQMPEVIRTALPSWWSIPKRDDNYRQDLLRKANLQGVDQPLLIVAGGPYSERRMSPQLLEALAFLPNNYAVIFTDMRVGSSQRIKCEFQINKLSLEHRVLMFDSFSYEKLLRLYAVCDIGVLLYPNNAIGNYYQAPGRLTEFLFTGLAITASNFPGLELLISKYKLGTVANPYDSQDIAQSITSLIPFISALRSEERERIINEFKLEFSYEKQAQVVFSKIFDLNIKTNTY